MELLQTYPYLASNLGNLAVFALLAAIGPALVLRFALAGAALALPCAFQARLDAPAYWNPTRLFTVGGVGLEDFIFALTAGGLACLLAAWPVKASLAGPFNRRGWPLRYLVLATAGLGSRLILNALHAPVGAALVGSTAILAAVMLLLQPARWPLALAGALLFTPVYFLLVKAAFVLAPAYRGQWNPDALWGPELLGIPLDELVWSLCLGIAWPLSTAYVFHGRLENRKEAI